MSKLNEITNVIVIQMVRGAREVFGHGIYIPYKEGHPCGWDWLDFTDIDTSSDEEILNYRFSSYDISEGMYNDHDYEDKTLKEVLELTEGRYEFEFEDIDW